MSDKLVYLTAAYTVIWFIICFFLFSQIKKNRQLLSQIEELETRVAEIESGKQSAPSKNG